MNAKRPFRSNAPKPVFLHEIQVRSGTKTYTLAKGQLVSVIRKPGLIAGEWEFLYAQEDASGLAIHVEGPVSRERRRRVIREADIKRVHIKSEAR